MFRITAETCRSFTLAEILILAAMNVETVRQASEGRFRPETAAKPHYLNAAAHVGC